MKVYEGKIADNYRNKFVETFVDCKSAYYQERIQVLQKFTDGDCYTGYLWDCLKSPIVDSEEKAWILLIKERKVWAFKRQD